MSSNVGLSTPRGSGTSGYVQKNLSFLRPKNFDRNAPYSNRDEDRPQHSMRREPNKEILEHDRKREVEVKCFELQDKLEEEGKLAEEEIEEEVDALRQKLLAELASNSNAFGNGKRLNEWQTHEIAARKIQENERFERAIGLKRDGNGMGMGPPPQRRQWDRGVEETRDDSGRGSRDERRRSRSPRGDPTRGDPRDGPRDRSRDRYERRERSPSRDRDGRRSRSRGSGRRYHDPDNPRNHREQRERDIRARSRDGSWDRSRSRSP